MCTVFCRQQKQTRMSIEVKPTVFVRLSVDEVIAVLNDFGKWWTGKQNRFMITKSADHTVRIPFREPEISWLELLDVTCQQNAVIVCCSASNDNE